jgi:dimethylargininase
VNDFLLIPSGFPKSKKRITDLGYNIIELDMSEFRKMDGGLTCLSLLF